MFFVLFALPSLLEHDLLCLPSVCLCHTIACLCSCVHCSLVENVLHRTKNNHHADSMTLFICQERELTASTSMGSECPRDPVSLGLEARILKQNFASRASSKVRKRFEWSLRCFSSSSGTNQCLQTSKPDLIAKLVLQLLLVARLVGLPAFDSRLELQKRAPSRKNDRAQKCFVSFLVSSDHIASARHASNGFFRELATMSAMSAVCICCNTNSRVLHSCPHSCPSARTRDHLLSS